MALKYTEKPTKGIFGKIIEVAKDGSPYGWIQLPKKEGNEYVFRTGVPGQFEVATTLSDVDLTKLKTKIRNS